MALTTLSAVLFGVTPAVASLIYRRGGNAVTLTFYRNLMVVPVLLVLMKRRGISFRVTGREVGLIVLMGVGFRATTTLMLFQSYTYIPTGMSTTLHFLYPVGTALLCRLLFREKLGPWKAAALALAGAGMLCFLELDPRGAALAALDSLAALPAEKTARWRGFCAVTGFPISALPVERTLRRAVEHPELAVIPTLALKARDLMALGLKGPEISAAQKKLALHVLERPEDNTPERLRALLGR